MSATPPTTPIEQDDQTLVYNMLAGAMQIIGACGVAVPAVFQTKPTLWVIAGGICTLAGSAWSLYQHWSKNGKIKALAAQLTVLKTMQTASRRT